MSYDNWKNRTTTDDRREEKPPYSKIFVLFSKEYDMKEPELREAFGSFGEIERIFIPKDRNSGGSQGSTARGMAYVKYAKTSAAAAAIENMNQKTISDHSKPIKVLLATHRNDKNDDVAEKCSRLFVKVSKQTTEKELHQYFAQFGDVHSVFLLKDRSSQENKGLAYVNFKSFLDAAKAYEQCDESYRAVFATPKSELKRSRDNNESGYDNSNYHSREPYSNSRMEAYTKYNFHSGSNRAPLITTPSQNFKKVCVTCSPGLAQRYIDRLFNIIPGMEHCQYTSDNFQGICKAVITYDNERSAAYAVEKLNNYEFPSGEIVTVKPDDPLSNAAENLSTIVNNFKNAVDTNRPELLQLADVIAQASSLLKVATTGGGAKSENTNYCSVPLPPVQPVAGPNAKVVKRCFVVCKDNPPPIGILRDAFSRFGDFIDFGFIKNKRFGFAKYGSAEAAEAAINTLHNATICGVHLRVLEADDKPTKDGTNDVDMEDVDDTTGRKKMKLGLKED